MDTKTAQLEVWAAREGERRKGRRVRGSSEREGIFIFREKMRIQERYVEVERLGKD